MLLYCPLLAVDSNCLLVHGSKCGPPMVPWLYLLSDGTLKDSPLLLKGRVVMPLVLRPPGPQAPWSSGPCRGPMSSMGPQTLLWPLVL
ncbi:unnamed protein product [Gadus morhua 'NCC']